MRANRPGSRIPQLWPTLNIEKLAWKDTENCIFTFLRQKYQYTPKIYGDSGAIRL